MRPFARPLLGAVLTGLMVTALAAPSAGADSTPAPTPRTGLGSAATPCPPGTTPTMVTSAPARSTRPSPARSSTRDPNVTTYPDGHTVRQACALSPPVPMVGPVIAPAHTVGGPLLARPGVVADLPAGIPAPPDMPHVSYVLADLQTGQVLAAKAAHALLYPASTLKTLTALVTLPTLDPRRVVTATDQDVTVDGTRVGMIAGNPYTVEDLYNGLVMVSGNDTAYAIARVFGGRDATIAAMNAKAAQLGAWDTVAVDPSGLDADGQRTSAYDLALIGRAVMALPEYRRHAAMLSATFPGGTDPTGKVYPPFQISNHNPIIGSYAGTIGVKNGYTTRARNTFVAAVTRGGRTLLLAEMGSVDRQVESTSAMLDWGFAYAARVRPVGTLVDPGTAARPPEWGASAEVVEPSPPPSDEPTITVALAPPAATAAPSPVAVESQLAAGLTGWWQGLADPVRYASLAGIAVLLVTALAIGVRRSRRRRRGAFER